jgi:AraC family transcriptional regulator, transcriptional activator of pobA
VCNYLFLDNFYVNPYLKPDSATYAEIKHTIDWLLTERKRTDYSENIVRSLLQVLLAQIQRCVEAQSAQTLSKKYLMIYKTFKHLIDLHFKEPLTVSDYAAHYPAPSESGGKACDRQNRQRINPGPQCARS